MKKLLLIFTFCFSIVAFGQRIDNNGISENQDKKSISNVSAHPNPLSFSTKISFKINKAQTITLTIKNLLGKTVFKKSFDSKEGLNTIQFYKNNLDSGMYLYSVQTDSQIVSKRLVIR